MKENWHLKMKNIYKSNRSWARNVCYTNRIFKGSKKSRIQI